MHMAGGNRALKSSFLVSQAALANEDAGGDGGAQLGTAPALMFCAPALLAAALTIVFLPETLRSSDSAATLQDSEPDPQRR